jgi:hypothetical protein
MCGCWNYVQFLERFSFFCPKELYGIHISIENTDAKSNFGNLLFFMFACFMALSSCSEFKPAGFCSFCFERQEKVTIGHRVVRSGAVGLDAGSESRFAGLCHPTQALSSAVRREGCTFTYQSPVSYCVALSTEPLNVSANWVVVAMSGYFNKTFCLL